MKTTLLTIAAALTLSAVSFAHAEPQVIGDNATDSVRVQARAQYVVPTEEFQVYATPYKLSNGEYMKVSQRTTRYYTEIAPNLHQHGKRTEVFAVSPGVFVTASGARIQFHDDGEQLVISNYERLSMASNLPEGTTVVARR